MYLKIAFFRKSTAAIINLQKNGRSAVIIKRRIENEEVRMQAEKVPGKVMPQQKMIQNRMQSRRKKVQIIRMQVLKEDPLYLHLLNLPISLQMGMRVQKSP